VETFVDLVRTLDFTNLKRARKVETFVDLVRTLDFTNLKGRERWKLLWMLKTGGKNDS